MATFYFILGMVVVLVIAEVVAAFIAINIINSLKEQIRNFENQHEYIHHRIDEESKITNQEFQKVYQQLDSRLDKLENRLVAKDAIKKNKL
jgi:predicted PurR-regulated permease PerM